MNKLGFVVLLWIPAFAACSDGGERGTGVMHADTARAAMTELGAIPASMVAMDGYGVLVHVQKMVGASVRIATPTLDGAGLRGGVSPIPTPPVPMGTANCDAASCTFADYGIGIPYTAYRLDGTITRSGETLELALTHAYVDHLNQMRWMIDGSLTLTATGIDGRFHGHGEGAAGVAHDQRPVIRDVVVEYDAVQLDAQGCPIGGSLHVASVYTDPTGGQGNEDSPSFAIEGTVTFGPACDAAR